LTDYEVPDDILIDLQWKHMDGRVGGPQDGATRTVMGIKRLGDSAATEPSGYSGRCEDCYGPLDDHKDGGACA